MYFDTVIFPLGRPGRVWWVIVSIDPVMIIFSLSLTNEKKVMWIKTTNKVAMEELKNNYKEFVNQLFNRKQRKIEKRMWSSFLFYMLIIFLINQNSFHRCITIIFIGFCYLPFIQQDLLIIAWSVEQVYSNCSDKNKNCIGQWSLIIIIFEKFVHP